MADKMQFDLVSPERRLTSRSVTAVRIPGFEGDLTAMPDHAPVLTMLRPGVLSAQGDEGAQDYIVTGGFAEVSASGVTVLAEQALPVGEATQERLKPIIEAAALAVETASDDRKDITSKTHADMLDLAQTLAL